ncbi:MAG: calcium/sodium antiporter, partial [Xanthomonadales bacterium]|nr:calcium/sodium antiporter [Xanthomonadales bacterium]
LRIGLSPLAIGLTVVAFGTSVPELLVSIDAALSGANDISVGNVVGSNIANIALILGVAAVLRPMVVESKVIGVDVPIMVLATLIFLVMIAGGLVSRLEGSILTAGLILYVWFTIRLARMEADSSDRSAQTVTVSPSNASGRLAFLITLGLVLLFVGAHLLVLSAVELAELMNISQAAIGLTVVAVGTSLPEFATSVVACIKREGDIAIGNVVGSNCFNILGVLGLTAVVRPLEAGGINWIDLGVMTGLAVLLGGLLLHRLFIHRVHGALLVTVFVTYTVWRLI